MCTPQILNTLLSEIKMNLHTVFGSKLIDVILYGSYARGDFDEESDIDVIAIVDMDKSELSTYRRTVSEISGDIDLKYDVLLSVKLQDKNTFYKYRSVLPFFRNVINEGVRIDV